MLLKYRVRRMDWLKFGWIINSLIEMRKIVKVIIWFGIGVFCFFLVNS